MLLLDPDPVDQDGGAEVHQLVHDRRVVIHPEHDPLDADEVERDVERPLVVRERHRQVAVGVHVVDAAEDPGHQAVPVRVRRDEPRHLRRVGQDRPLDCRLLPGLEQHRAAEGGRDDPGAVPRQQERDVLVVVEREVGLDLADLAVELRLEGPLEEVAVGNRGRVLAGQRVVRVLDDDRRAISGDVPVGVLDARAGLLEAPPVRLGHQGAHRSPRVPGTGSGTWRSEGPRRHAVQGLGGLEQDRAGNSQGLIHGVLALRDLVGEDGGELAPDDRGLRI